MMRWNIWRIIKKISVSFALLLLASTLQAKTAAPPSFADRPDVQKFITMLVQDYGFNKAYLNNLFNQVQEQPSIIAGMSGTKEQLPWYKYKKIFITQNRIDEGVEFWKRHQKTLDTVSKRDGVDPAIIVAILGVETYYGKQQGNYRVIDSLASLAFDYPPREKFFREELKAYLLLTREENIDPLKLRGSYAGAMGQPQFMPSSYRLYAVDFDSSGSRDILNNPDDVIASVSNYFKQHGWIASQPIASTADVQGRAYKKVTANKLKPDTTLAKLVKQGIRTSPNYSLNTRATFLILTLPQNKQQYWVGYHNFYVISRYNPRLNYAMAVYQLSQAIKQQYARSS